MKRKTSTLPSRVYKYALLPPTEEDERVELSFVAARIYYNQLITIELVRRRRYRDLRSKLFPDLSKLEAQQAALVARLEAARVAIKVVKAKTRSRAVDKEAAEGVTTIKAELKAIRKLLKAERGKAVGSESLKDVGREEANAAIKALRPSLYWGTYLLLETQAKQASGASVDPDYNLEPAHCLSNRIGVHMNGGMGLDELSSSTLMQISPMPNFKTLSSGKLHARGKAARTVLKFRVGSTDSKKPIFASFPMIMDRPMPVDASIKDAYITRRPCSARVSWRYDLCIVLESGEFERRVSSSQQDGTTAINFGWRRMGKELRVAMVNNDVRGLEEIRLPEEILSGFAKCRELQGFLDQKFDDIKACLGSWILAHPESPEAFRSEFGTLTAWKSQHRLADLAWYWHNHRYSGDDEIYQVVAAWLDRYRHLADWLKHFQQHLFDSRRNFYGEQAKKIATTSAKIVMDTFRISSVAKRPEAEEPETGGQTARTNRQMAAPGELRMAILHAAAKYHCVVEVAVAKNGTRRCDVCGFVHPEAVMEIDHVCANPDGCGVMWDQDANNTDNLHTRYASGEVVTLIKTSKVAENGDIQGSQMESFGGARKALASL